MILWGIHLNVNAAENGAVSWSLSGVGLEHNSVSFSLSGVSSAQNAIAVVETISDGRRIEIPFEIKTSSAYYELKFPSGNFIKAAGDYYSPAYKVYIKDNFGNVTSSESRSLNKCYMPLSMVLAYPKQIEIRNYGSDSVVKYTASVGFQDYSQEVNGQEIVYIDYPEQSVGMAVQIKAECAYGCVEEDSVTIQENNIDKPDISAYGEYVLRDKVIVNYQRDDLRMCARINGKTYYGEYGGIKVNNYTQIAVKYPVVNEGTAITLWYESKKGGTSAEAVYKAEYCDTYDWDMYQNEYITHTQIKGKADLGKDAQKATKVSIIIAGKEYSSKVQSDGTFTISYPYQSSGTILTAVISDDHGCKKSVNLKVESRYYLIDISSLKVNGISGELDDDDASVIKEVYALIGTKKYTGKISGASGFSINYPKQKIGSKFRIFVKDASGYYYSKQITIKNRPPKIKLDNITSNSTKVTGKTTANATVKIKIGKKTYTKKAKANGKFSIKIKKAKAGTKVTISVESKEGFTNKKTKKIKLAYGNIEHYYIYPNSTTMRCIVKKAGKNDVIVVKVGNHVYKKKITKKTKNKVIRVKISKHPAGQKVQVILQDPFGKKKDISSSMVYIGNKIYVGMSARDALLTTLGSPDRKNNYGSFLQWVYESEGTTTYVYIRGGKVTNIQRFNY